MWKSEFMKRWEGDRQTIEDFVEKELPDYEAVLSDSSILPAEERKSLAQSLAPKLDSMLEIPSKWEGYGTLQKRIAECADKIAEMREAIKFVSEMAYPNTPSPPGSPPPETAKSLMPLLLKYYRSRGIVGEQELCLMQTFCAAHGLHFGIEGPSGSGKTMVVESLLSLLPPKSVFKIGVDSDTAVYYNADSINSCRFVYIPELQKAMQGNKTTIEFIKDIAEGRDSARRVKVGNETREYTISAGKTVIYTLANENGFKKDVETSRRMIILPTNCSASHVSRVITEKTRGRFEDDSPGIGLAELASLKLHMAKCAAVHKPRVRDPFAEHMARYVPEACGTTSFSGQYYSLIDACGFFNHPRRLRKDGVLFLSLEDHFIIHSLYLNILRGNIGSMIGHGTSDYARGINTRIAQGMLENSEKPVDWEACWHEGLRKMKEAYPSLAGEWAEMQSAGGYVTLQNPSDGNTVRFPSHRNRTLKAIAGLGAVGAIGLLYASQYLPVSSAEKPSSPEQGSEQVASAYRIAGFAGKEAQPKILQGK